MAPKDDYVFTRDFLDNNRLNLLHHYYVRDLGYLIHPRIPIQDADLKVADIGCGTGIWLLDASTRLPGSTQFVGLDISLDAVPPAELLPHNVVFRVWDMLRDPVPEELVGSFDVINIRLMLYVLQEEDVPATVDKLIQMLKTGGYLQWMEPDNETVRGEVTKTENTSDNMTRMMRLLDSQGQQMKPKWAPDLAQIFSDCGLVDVDADVHTSQPLWAFLEHECLLIMPELIARKTQNEELATELKRLVPLAEQETRKGAYLAVDKYVVTGKKA
ncbi:S-adenosyl-L-methionine-dependent methyltransferase [Xylariaceae sp. AK1471]|nr:S-adenosyl-L-methionine-dependent methyltransferase [Xylariaceae sp. AK1471]